MLNRSTSACTAAQTSTKRSSLIRQATITAMLLLAVVFGSAQIDCKKAKIGKWYITYNAYYKKYAVVRNDTLTYSIEKEFLVKNHYGEYGIYGTGWENCNGYYGCGDKSKSLFTNACDAVSFLMGYLNKLKNDNWQ